MKVEPHVRHGWKRRITVTAVGASALVIAAASVSWACTVHIGTIKVCAPAGTNNCVSETGTTGAGAQVSGSGTAIKTWATGLYAEPYSIYFQAPEKMGTGLCSEVGTKLGRNVRGPSWSGVKRTTPPTSTTGQAKICWREADGGVTGNGVGVSVI